jgi:ubiquinone/menaquinone biosynthesis C-methylase UbiE
MPEQPEILDVGCGKGVQTLELARISNGKIKAIDKHSFFLKYLEEKVKTTGYADRITTIVADMREMTFEPSSFDLIWSEGAVFIIGIKEGMKNWKKLLKKGGFLVLSDLVLLTDSRPQDLTDYLEGEELHLLTIPEVLAAAKKIGYQIMSHFTLPNEGWTEAYFSPQMESLAHFREKYSDSEEAQQTYQTLELEHEMIGRNLEYIGYEFFVLRNG